jgi:pimeloyl-ACP methyl ester carboxylesterase
MLSKLLLSFLILFKFSTPGYSQSPEKVWLNKTDSVYGYYVVIPPAGGRIQGALILLDGFGGNADGFFPETKIHNVAYVHDILTVCVPTGSRIYADSSMIALLNQIGSEITAKYGLRKDQFAIGGMSSGGTVALRYAELCAETPATYPINPQAVFVVDSPVDLLGLYRSSEKELERGKPDWWWLGEAQMIVDRLKNELGDPKSGVSKFGQLSPFNNDTAAPGNERFLKDIAMRTYHDVDVSWHIKNRHRGFSGANMLLASELVNRLVLLGNEQAEFISSKITGYRANGQRHPHSWNIVDEIELVQWLKRTLHFYPGHLKDSFVYEAPAKWGRETILFPFAFAPSITYKGFEELRFAPGWGDVNSGEKWAYTILWWLDGAYNFNESILAADLENYFSGLTRQRAIADKQDMKMYEPAKVSVQKQKTAPGDLQTYAASARIYDAHVSKKPDSLYFKIHVKDCAGKSRTLVLIEVAGTPSGAPVWKQLDKINQEFRCAK